MFCADYFLFVYFSVLTSTTLIGIIIINIWLYTSLNANDRLFKENNKIFNHSRPFNGKLPSQSFTSILIWSHLMRIFLYIWCLYNLMVLYMIDGKSWVCNAWRLHLLGDSVHSMGKIVNIFAGNTGHRDTTVFCQINTELLCNTFALQIRQNNNNTD